MTKVGSQGTNAGRAGWGTRSANDRNEPGTNGSKDVHGKQAFQRVLDRGARNFNQACAEKEQAASGESQKAHINGQLGKPQAPGNGHGTAFASNPVGGGAVSGTGGAEPVSIGPKTATYDTTKILEMAEFIRQFPEAAPSIKQILAHCGDRKTPSIAIVNSCNTSKSDDIQRIGNTVFMSGDAASAASTGKLDSDVIEKLVAAIGHFMGSH